MPDENKAVIAVLGGTGKEGGGLALRWAHRGHKVILGSRSAERARDAAAAMNTTLGGSSVTGVTVPLVPPKVSRVQLPEGGSAVEAVQKKLGDAVRVVSAFQNISAHHLTRLDEDVECDVLVCADDPEAAELVIALAEEIGLRAWNAGVLANSVVAEGLTSVLIALNRRYKVPGSGIRITGVPTHS
jgi:predicted dinucleotide-binding enzyme